MKQILAVLMLAIATLAVPAATPAYAQGDGSNPSIDISIYRSSARYLVVERSSARSACADSCERPRA